MFRGYNKDVTYSNMQTGESPFAKNIVVTQKYLSPSNEPGFTKQLDVNGTIIGVIPTNYKDVLFITSDEGDEIGTFDGNTYTCIVKGQLGFNSNYPIEGTFKYNFNQQLTIAFTDNLNTPKIINLDCLPFEVNEFCEIIDTDKLRLLDITPKLEIPEITLQRHTFGGSVETGSYWVFLAYEYEDGSKTNWIKSSNTIIVEDNIENESFSNYQGEEGGKISNKIVNLTLTNLDSAFNKIVVGIIRQRNGIKDAFILPTFNYTNSNKNIEYRGTETVVNISIDELVIPTEAYVKAKTITSLQDRLYLGNVALEKEIDWQQYANNVNITWFYGNPFNLLSNNDSYKSPLFIFDKRTFRTDEVYDFYGVFKLKTGNYSKAFHIPGNPANSIVVDNTTIPTNYTLQQLQRENIAIEGLSEYLNIAPNASLFHLLNTSEVTINNSSFLEGNMGFFETQNERYPDNDCSNIRDSSNNIIGTLANNKKRFHRFPSLSQLTNWKGEYLDYVNTDLLKAELTATGFTVLPGSPTTAALDYSVNNNTLLPTLDSDANPDGSIQYIAESSGSYRLEINTRITDFRNQLDIKIGTIIDGVVSYFLDVEQDSSISNRDYLIELNEVIDLKEGDRIFIDIKLIATGIYQGGNVDNNANSLSITSLDLNNLEVNTNRLGIRLNNIYIPDEIKNEVAHLEIFYAKRTNQNSTVVGQSCLDLTEVDNVRSYDFDLLTSKNAVSITHISTELSFDSPNTNMFSDTTINTLNIIKEVTDKEFIPSNTSVPVDNKKREQYLKLALSNLTDLPNNNLVLANLKSHKNNLYEQVELISTGYTIGVNVVNSNVIYGGDTIISAYGHVHSAKQTSGFYNIVSPELTVTTAIFNRFALSRLGAIPNPNISDQALLILFSIWFYPVESVFNIGLRHFNDIDDNTNFYPNSVELPTEIDVTINKSNFPLIEESEYYIDNYNYLYNSDYNEFPLDFSILIYNCNNDCNKSQINFPTRIARSIISNNEEYQLSWRTFLVEDYEEMPKDKGVLWKLATFNKSLLIHLEYSLFVAIVKDRLATNNQQVFLGTGEIFDRQPDEIIGTREGYAGTQSQWGSFVCKLGYIFVDLDQGKIFIFNGKLKEISNDKTRTWFNTYFTTNNKITKEETFPVIDNPFIESGVVGWYDEKFNRLCIGFTFRKNKEISREFGKLLSYYPDLEAWVSEHDYFPSYAYHTRRGIYSINNKILLGESEIYLHNQNNYGIFYEDIIYPAFIDVLISTPNKETVRWNSIFWNSLVTFGTKTLKDKTFTNIAIYTEDQCTGLIELNTDKNLYSSNKNTRNRKYVWSFNKIRDIVINKDEEIIDSSGVINLLNLNENKTWFELSKFYNSFIVIRFYYNNIEQYEIYLNNVNVNITK